jgi:hypothetical protein
VEEYSHYREQIQSLALRFDQAVELMM